MFKLDENTIKKYATDSTYLRGLSYYIKNKVNYIDVEYGFDEKMDEEVVNLFSEVDSSEDWTYDVDITWGQNTGFKHIECNCETFYNNYNNNKLCKHIVAVLLKYLREENKIAKQNCAEADYFVEHIKRSIMHQQLPEKCLNLEVKYNFLVDFGNCSYIELKVGQNRNYVVKNIRSFLETIKYKKAPLEFGKSFTFDPNIHKFNEQDQKLLNMLMEIYESDLKLKEDYYGYLGSSNRFLSGKKAYLTESQLKRFFSIMKDRSFHGEIMGKYYDDLKILEEDLPLDFNLCLEENHILLSTDKELPTPLTETGDFFFYKNNIYKSSEEQIALFSPYYNELLYSKTSYIKFKKEDEDKIVSYILPNLKKICNSLTIDNKLKSRFYEKPLSISIYLDRINDYIAAQPVFKYGDLEITPFDEAFKKENEKILIRDIHRELSSISILESFGFQAENNKFLLKSQENLIEFLTEGLQKLQKVADVYYSESFKRLKVYNSSSFKSSISLTESGLLEFSFSIEGVDKSELKNILEALKEKKKYHRLKDGGFVFLQDKKIIDLGNMIEYLDIKDSDLKKDSIELSKYKALYIDENIELNAMTFIERNSKFRELANNLRDFQKIDYTLPKNLEKTLRGYQKFGFKWLKTLSICGFGGILADEMGLGKTLQTISFIEDYCNENAANKKPSLVVAPTSLIYNWKAEIEKFSPKLNALVISGSKEERENQRKAIENSDIVITSYALIRRDIEEYKNLKFKYCILDEAQNIKNAASINAQSVKEIIAETRFALTGTPIENSLTELWSIFDFIMPGYLMSHRKFSKKFEIPIVKRKDEKALEALNRHIKPFILRRLKSEVIKELPPKIEHKVIVEMTDNQKKLYAAYLMQFKNQIKWQISENGFDKSRFAILSALTRLRQICCEPSVFIENYTGESGKINALDDILEESIQGGHRILLFSQFTSVLKIISKRLNKNGIEYLYLDGSTKGELRGKLVNDFNQGQGAVFLISLKAGGTGLNLTGADVVIHFDPWWNPAVEAQATDRAHRIGQKKTVEVISLIARGTIEEKIYDLQQKKKEIITNVLDNNKNEDILISQMNQEEIERLLEI